MSSLFQGVKQQRESAHDRLLAVVADLSDEQLRWRPAPRSPTIGFHLWHTARWNDVYRALMGGGDELWVSGRLAERWELNEVRLGDRRTGMGMADQDSELLMLPNKKDLVAYAEQCFRAFDSFVSSLAIDSLDQPYSAESDRTRESAVLMHLAHDNRHLGMIEALRGVLGLQGTATQ